MKKASVVIIVLLIAALSFWAGGRLGGKQPPGPADRSARKILYYADPMNPGFRSDRPGVAPCGMPLEPVYAEAGKGSENSATALPAGAVKVSPARQQLIGVKIAAVENKPMTYTLRLYGKIVPDETRVYRVNASTDSWIRELSNVTTGSIVSKDQMLAVALAPAYYNAQVTYLVALNNLDRIRQQLGGELRHQQGELADNQIRMAVQALQNLGITNAQVEELANTRRAQPYLQIRAPARGVVLKRNISLNQWFKAAEEFYTIADIRRVWVYADVYEDEAMHLRPGMRVKVKHRQLGKTFDARVSEVLSLFDPVSKTLKVRLDVDNPRYDLRPDMFVDVEIPISMPPSLNVPADAVIDSGTRTVVYVNSGDGVFEPRRVETGWRLGRRVEITGGLMSGEKVVVSGNFLIDSESRMKTAAAGPEVRMNRDPVCGMDVDEEKAVNDGRTAALAGKTYYFCSEKCRKTFEKEQQMYAHGKIPGMPQRDHAAMHGMVHIGRPAAGVTEARIGKDPVCGMDVDEEKAENDGRTAALAGKTYYFCSGKCWQAFKRDPKKYAGGEMPAMPNHNHAAIHGMDGGRMGADKPAKNSDRGAKPRGTDAGGEMKARAGKRANSPGVVDWDGPEPENGPPRDWRGWGKFPGAEYLGLKQPKDAPVRQQDTPAAGNGKTARGARDVPSHGHDSGLSHDTQGDPSLESAGRPANQ